jgi:hypothetical protein
MSHAKRYDLPTRICKQAIMLEKDNFSASAPVAVVVDG